MKTMRMILLHGRDDPAQDMDDWGYTGPTINGIKAFHGTYLGDFNLYFTTMEDTLRAKAITGWEQLAGDCALNMSTNNGLIVVNNKFYGDFELQTMDPEGREVG